MGVIRDLNNVVNPFGVRIEETLEDIIDEVLEQEENHYRRTRRIKQRSTVRPEATGVVAASRTRSGKKHRRVENNNFLISLASGAEEGEITIYDFVPDTVSPLTQLLTEKNKMEIWNDFISRSDEEQWIFLEQADNPSAKFCSEASVSESEPMSEDTVQDKRNDHPGFSAELCFQKIDSDLRHILRKKHVPLGTLSYLEDQVSSFFEEKPRSVLRFQLESSFERLMLHALCQYMDLTSTSYNEGAIRWTKVRNRHHKFSLPRVLLSSYLEHRVSRKRPS